uniref:Integrase n=1 Tax=Siphoviridae sp. ctvNP11 TaxID=2825721 RepID=A0A8S5PDD9_9CAUD|nr:MAG TPA: integrase [Siphoviridae sp. ctvNP11]
MISNETYVGDKRLQKKAPVDYLTKKPDPNRKVESKYLWDDHEAIVDRETWDKAQEILEERKELAKKGIRKTNREHHFLYGKVFCGECGAPFLRRTFNGSTPYKAWNCRNRQKGKGEVKCSNRFIREEQLLDQIQEELGWSDMDQERFKKKVSQVLVFADHIEVIKK